MADILSLLLQQQGTPDPAKKTNDPGGVPQAAAEPRPPAPAPTAEAAPIVGDVRAHHPAQAPHVPHRRESRDYVDPAPAVSAGPRVHVPHAPTSPKSLGEIASERIPRSPRSAGRRLPAGVGARLLIYPVLLLGLGVSVFVAWDQLFPRSVSAGQEKPGSGEKLGAALRSDVPKSPVGGSAPPPALEKEGPAGAEKPAAAPKEEPKGEVAPGSKGYVVRTVTYPDSPDGEEQARSTVAGLQERGFSDARMVRYAPTKDGRRGSLVVLVGLGESPRDPKLTTLVDRLVNLPGFGTGQQRQRPFADAFTVVQPEADRTARGR